VARAIEHTLEFATTTAVCISLPRPKGLVAVFGPDARVGEPPASLRLRLLVDPPTGRVQKVDVSGRVAFRLPRGLACPVDAVGGEWVESTNRHLLVPLGSSVLTLARGAPPTITPALAAPAGHARLGSTGLVARLDGATITITGTAPSPVIRFEKVAIVHRPA
jgi:hypothetical protein